jgi:hypothetical protein
MKCVEIFEEAGGKYLDLTDPFLLKDYKLFKLLMKKKEMFKK